MEPAPTNRRGLADDQAVPEKPTTIPAKSSEGIPGFKMATFIFGKCTDNTYTCISSPCLIILSWLSDGVRVGVSLSLHVIIVALRLCVLFALLVLVQVMDP